MGQSPFEKAQQNSRKKGGGGRARNCIEKNESIHEGKHDAPDNRERQTPMS